ncbi:MULTISPECIES: HigA family addiction module antitoxin [unclassified Ruegeria]|uniref:HigA family addiction module antitoxin n=1 Tax=unclassified Ruegeria TaxID=2625375 RepID=UPI00147E716F|nr:MULTISPECIES: HigA family addiction module antitoxin [unclassified Ruegeria]
MNAPRGFSVPAQSARDGLSPIKLARMLNVPRTRIERLVAGSTGVSPDTASRLAKVIKTTPELWLNMQTSFELARAADEIDLTAIQPIEADAA